MSCKNKAEEKKYGEKTERARTLKNQRIAGSDPIHQEGQGPKALMQSQQQGNELFESVQHRKAIIFRFRFVCQKLKHSELKINRKLS